MLITVLIKKKFFLLTLEIVEAADVWKNVVFNSLKPSIMARFVELSIPKEREKKTMY